MSFPKAKVQRFNELSNDVPPPGSYDPKFDTKVKGSVIEKSERFHDDKSTDSAEFKLSVSRRSTGTVNSSFRTPKFLSTCNKSRLPVKIRLSVPAPQSSDFQYESEHQLADLQVECINKDKTIEEQGKYIEDMKEELQRMQSELEELHMKEIEMKENHKKHIEGMTKLHEELLNDHNKKYQAEKDYLSSQLLEAAKENDYEIQVKKELENDLTHRVGDFSNRMNALEIEMSNKKHISETKIQSLEVQIQELNLKQQELLKNHKVETKSLEEAKLKLHSSVNGLTDERKDLELKLQEKENIIVELQEQISSLQSKLSKLKNEYKTCFDDYEKQVNELTRKHKNEICKLKIDIETEKMTLQNKRKQETCCRLEAEIKLNDIDKGNKLLKLELQEMQQLYKDASSNLTDAGKKVEDLHKEHSLILKNHEEELGEVTKLHDSEKIELKKKLEEISLNYLKEIENLKVARDKEITELKEASVKKINEKSENMKEQANKMVNNIEAVTKKALEVCRAENDEEIQSVIAESNAMANNIMRDAKSFMEEEIQLTAQRYKACLLHIEVEQAGLQKKLSQKSNEISQFSTYLETLKSECQESFGQDLQGKLNRAEAKLAERKEVLNTLKDKIHSEGIKMKTSSKRLEAVIAKDQASINALTERLAQINANMKSSESELQSNDNYLREYHNLWNIMLKNSQEVHKQSTALIEQLNTVKQLVYQFESNNSNEIETIKSIYKAKIEDLKQKMKEKIVKLQADCITKDNKNVEIDQQLHEAKDRLNQVQNVMIKMEEKTDNQKYKLLRLKTLNCKLNKQLEEDTMIIKKNNNLLEVQSIEHANALEEADYKIEEHLEQIKYFEERDDNAQDETDLFEEERSQWEAFNKVILEEVEEVKTHREAAEEEIRNLTEHNERLKSDYQEINDKYAQVIGHQNHKQRIKHVSQLQDRVNQLEQDLIARIRTLEQQQKVIEKLQLEDKYRKEKANMLDVTKTICTTPAPSPYKSQTPLKCQNEQF